jgi:unsaturated pyranuronate lyase
VAPLRHTQVSFDSERGIVARLRSEPSSEPVLATYNRLVMSKYIVRLEDCSRHDIFPGVQIHTTAGEKMLLSFVEFAPHAVVEPHSHPHEQMGLLLEGDLTFVIGGESHVVRPGEMWRIPGGVIHSATAGDQPVKALDVFYPIREDYR